MGQLEKRNLVFIGDVHGNWEVISRYITDYDLKNTDIIQVGDFGIGYRNVYNDLAYLQRLSDVLSTLNSCLYVIRGNHDDPTFFDGSRKYTFESIKFLSDYSFLRLDTANIFCVGGAISIDRVPRQRHIGGWFSGEEFQVSPHLIPDNTHNIDIVVTHTAGTNCYPIGVNGLVMSFAANDPTLLQELKIEREKVDRLFELIKEKGHAVKSHFYGHFHNSNTEIVDNIDRRLLNINEIYEFRY